MGRDRCQNEDCNTTGGRELSKAMVMAGITFCRPCSVRLNLVTLHRGVPAKNFSCKSCGRQFRDGCNLEQHTRACNPDVPKLAVLPELELVQRVPSELQDFSQQVCCHLQNIQEDACCRTAGGGCMILRKNGCDMPRSKLVRASIVRMWRCRTAGQTVLPGRRTLLWRGVKRSTLATVLRRGVQIHSCCSYCSGVYFSTHV